MHFPIKPLVLAARCAALSLISVPVWAAELPVAGGTLQVKGSVYAGTVIRTSDRDAELMPAANASEVGVDGSAGGGKNQDDGNLNFKKGEPVSTALKGHIDLRYTRGAYGLVGQAQGWYDTELRDGDRPWGNSANNFAADEPLSDDGFDSRSKFSGVALGELYAFGRHTLGTRGLDWKLGQQRIDWGGKFTISGGLGDLSPNDAPARRRAGALADEGRVAVPAVSARLALTPRTTLDGFVQTHFEPNVPFGCGTLFSQLDFVAEGCDKVVVGQQSDRASLAAGQFFDRGNTRKPTGLQGGLAVLHTLPAIDAELGLYFTQVHARKAYYGAIKSGRDAAQPPFIPGNADGLNPLYYTEYAEDVRMAGLSFNKKLKHGALMAEATYRPNQPFQFNAADLISAFASNVAPTPLRAGAAALAPGERYEGFDRYKAAQLNLGAAHGLPGFFGAKNGLAGIELAYKWSDLPSVSERRYGRPDVYGQAPLNGAACPPSANAVTCSNDGYLTQDAFAYRLRVGLKYPALFTGVDVSPTLTFGHDVHGWSEDGAISEDRQFALVSLKSEIRKAYQLELSWQPVWGGDYNNLKDRDVLALSIGYPF